MFKAPEDVEMEDLNYYYANYSRYVVLPPLGLTSHSDGEVEYTMMLSRSVKGRATCSCCSAGPMISQCSSADSQDQVVVIPCPIAVRQDLTCESLCPSTVILVPTVLQFEDLISTTVEETKDIPEIISETGKIGMPHKGEHDYRWYGMELTPASEIMQQIGQLFLLRTNINSVGSVLDSPVSPSYQIATHSLSPNISRIII